MLLEIFWMHRNIIEISTDNKKLSVYLGFLRISEDETIIKDVPFNSINSLLVTAHGVTYTNELLQRLCEENIPLIILGKNYVPSGMLLSYTGQSKQMEVQHLQIDNKKPVEKRIWQLLIKEKIKNQSRVLAIFRKSNKLANMYKDVLSADSSNREAYAAKIYFKELFGENFARRDENNIINGFLNYGYAIIRSALARYVVATGLNPSYGIIHNNKLNPFCLVDDLIEPFRPMVDCCVHKIFSCNKNISDLNKENKAILSGLLTKECFNGNGTSPFYRLLQQAVWDLVNIYKSKEVNFNFVNYLQYENA